MITVATWNVLHPVHGKNWDEEALTRWPDESERIAAITARLAERTERVIALQEVSGDQLASVRRALPRHTIHALRYPRVPVPREGPNLLKDPGEYLVLLIDGPTRQVASETFDGAPGKGLLAVRIEGALVVSTHVSGNQQRVGELARLAQLAELIGLTGLTGLESAGQPAQVESDATATVPVVLLGDFNCDRATVSAGLGPEYTVAELPPGTAPTRPGGNGGSPSFIDHVAVRGGDASNAAVEDVAGLSDHNLLSATVGSGGAFHR